MKTKGITMRTPRTGTGGIFGRIFATVFGLIFGSIGLMMMVLAVRDSLQRLETRHWVATPCEIVESGITEEGEQYRFDAVFTYNYNGQSHIARNFTHKGGLRKERIGDAQRLLNQYAKGAGATCHVNPAAPDEALILRDLSLGGLVGPVLFMLPFVLFGYGLIFLVWRFRRPEAQSGTTSSNTKPSRAAMAFPIIFGVVFIAVGLFVTCAFSSSHFYGSRSRAPGHRSRRSSSKAGCARTAATTAQPTVWTSPTATASADVNTVATATTSAPVQAAATRPSSGWSPPIRRGVRSASMSIPPIPSTA